jgi:endonuclease III
VQRWTLTGLVARLKKLYGDPAPPPSQDPWLLILWENVAYLADDVRRREAFATLRRRVGTKPKELLAAADEALLEVAGHGILAGKFAAKLRDCATLALELFPETAGDFAPLREWPLARQRKTLARFPGIGAPGAEKILLFARLHAALPLESNGLRVLTRVGFAPEQASYSATYRLVQQPVEAERPDGFDELVVAHQLLRRHGQELCKRSRPLCGGCPLRSRCLHGVAAE